MSELYQKELDEWFKKDEEIKLIKNKMELLEIHNYSYEWTIESLEKSCTQKENEIQELKKKIQREQTWKSNARKQLKKRTKQRDDLLKKIKNNTTL